MAVIRPAHRMGEATSSAYVLPVLLFLSSPITPVQGWISGWSESGVLRDFFGATSSSGHPCTRLGDLGSCRRQGALMNLRHGAREMEFVFILVTKPGHITTTHTPCPTCPPPTSPPPTSPTPTSTFIGSRPPSSVPLPPAAPPPALQLTPRGSSLVRAVFPGHRTSIVYDDQDSDFDAIFRVATRRRRRTPKLNLQRKPHHIPQ